MQLTISPAAACGEVLLDGHSGGPYRRCLPAIHGPRPDWMAREIWARFYENVIPPGAQLVRLRDATIRGPGVITLPGDIIVGESLINCNDRDSVASLLRTAPGQYQPGPDYIQPATTEAGPAVLVKQMWDHNYGHWLIEVLPRLGLLDGLIDPATCRFIIAPATGPIQAVQQRSLAAHGIAPSQLLVQNDQPLHVADLIYPVPLTVQPWVKAPLAIRHLERLADRITGPDHRPANPRLFVRRPAASRRALRNQPAIRAIAERAGYRVVSPGEMSFPEQVRAFAGATHIVGTLGAECANIAFAAPGLRFLGLAPRDMMDDFFYDLVSLKLGNYTCLHGEPAESGMNAAFSIDPAQFAALLGAI